MATYRFLPIAIFLLCFNLSVTVLSDYQFMGIKEVSSSYGSELGNSTARMAEELGASTTSEMGFYSTVKIVLEALGVFKNIFAGVFLTPYYLNNVVFNKQLPSSLVIALETLLITVYSLALIELATGRKSS